MYILYHKVLNKVSCKNISNMTKYFAFLSCIFLTACEPTISADNKIAIIDQSSADIIQERNDFIVSVFGTIHSGHRRSNKYSLQVLEKAIIKFEPDIIFIETPPSSLAAAQSSFAQFGEVRERRTRAFPELTDVVFPLQKKLGYSLVATAGWSRQLANNRATVLKKIENDPARKSQWQEHITARDKLFRIQRNNSNDPLYIHTDKYDAEVKAAQTPYETYFDKDIGPGGWGPINKAHINLMVAGLDDIKTNSLNDKKPHRVLIIFGAWHKYKILEAMEKRDDVALLDARQFFKI